MTERKEEEEDQKINKTLIFETFDSLSNLKNNLLT